MMRASAAQQARSEKIEQIMEEITKHKHLSRVRKSKNFPGSKIFHPKTFWIKRVNLDIFDFATNVRKTRQFHVFLAKMHKIRQKGK